MEGQLSFNQSGEVLHERMANRDGWRNGRGSLNSNQKSLVAITCVFWIMGIVIFVASFKGREGLSVSLGFLSFFVVMGLLPLAFIWISKLRRRSRNSLNGFIRSASAQSGLGFQDVTIKAEESLPRVCIRCGTETRRTSPYKIRAAHTEYSRYDWSRVHPLLFIFLAIKFGAHLLVLKLSLFIGNRLNRRAAAARAIKFEIPHCKTCAKGSPIIQRHFDFHSRSMILEANREFIKQLKEKRDAQLQARID